MVRIRIVDADFYLGKPIQGLDVLCSNFRGTTIQKVPIIRIFGANHDGHKTCLHVHGVFPYIYIPYDGKENPDVLSYQIAAAIDKTVNISLGQTGSRNQHVYKIDLVSGIPFYGYHAREHQFFKIFFYNPFVLKKTCGHLSNGKILDRIYQPHEGHIPYLQQFMIDYNLHGMSYISLEKVFYRHNTDHPPPLNTPSPHLLPGHVTRSSRSLYECDALAADILNARGEIASNPGIAAIWEDERRRRHDLDHLSSQISHGLNISVRSQTAPSASHDAHRAKLTEKLRSESLPSSGDPNGSVYPAETPESGASCLNCSVMGQDGESEVGIAGDVGETEGELYELLTELRDGNVEEDSILSQVVVEEGEDEEELSAPLPVQTPMKSVDEFGDDDVNDSFFENIPQIDGVTNDTSEKWKRSNKKSDSVTSNRVLNKNSAVRYKKTNLCNENTIKSRFNDILSGNTTVTTKQSISLKNKKINYSLVINHERTFSQVNKITKSNVNLMIPEHKSSNNTAAQSIVELFGNIPQLDGTNDLEPRKTRSSSRKEKLGTLEKLRIYTDKRDLIDTYCVVAKKSSVQELPKLKTKTVTGKQISKKLDFDSINNGAKECVVNIDCLNKKENLNKAIEKIKKAVKIVDRLPQKVDIKKLREHDETFTSVNPTTKNGSVKLTKNKSKLEISGIESLNTKLNTFDEQGTKITKTLIVSKPNTDLKKSCNKKVTRTTKNSNELVSSDEKQTNTCTNVTNCSLQLANINKTDLLTNSNISPIKHHRKKKIKCSRKRHQSLFWMGKTRFSSGGTLHVNGLLDTADTISSCTINPVNNQSCSSIDEITINPTTTSTCKSDLHQENITSSKNTKNITCKLSHIPINCENSDITTDYKRANVETLELVNIKKKLIVRCDKLDLSVHNKTLEVSCSEISPDLTSNWKIFNPSSQQHIEDVFTIILTSNLDPHNLTYCDRLQIFRKLNQSGYQQKNAKCLAKFLKNNSLKIDNYMKIAEDRLNKQSKVTVSINKSNNGIDSLLSVDLNLSNSSSDCDIIENENGSINKCDIIENENFIINNMLEKTETNNITHFKIRDKKDNVLNKKYKYNVDIEKNLVNEVTEGIHFCNKENDSKTTTVVEKPIIIPNGSFSKGNEKIAEENTNNSNTCSNKANLDNTSTNCHDINNCTENLKNGHINSNVSMKNNKIVFKRNGYNHSSQDNYQINKITKNSDFFGNNVMTSNNCDNSTIVSSEPKVDMLRDNVQIELTNVGKVSTETVHNPQKNNRFNFNSVRKDSLKLIKNETARSNLLSGKAVKFSTNRLSMPLISIEDDCNKVEGGEIEFLHLLHPENLSDDTKNVQYIKQKNCQSNSKESSESKPEDSILSIPDESISSLPEKNITSISEYKNMSSIHQEKSEPKLLENIIANAQVNVQPQTQKSVAGFEYPLDLTKKTTNRNNNSSSQINYNCRKEGTSQNVHLMYDDFMEGINDICTKTNFHVVEVSTNCAQKKPGDYKPFSYNHYPPKKIANSHISSQTNCRNGSENERINRNSIASQTDIKIPVVRKRKTKAENVTEKTISTPSKRGRKRKNTDNNYVPCHATKSTPLKIPKNRACKTLVSYNDYTDLVYINTSPAEKEQEIEFRLKKNELVKKMCSQVIKNEIKTYESLNRGRKPIFNIIHGSKASLAPLKAQCANLPNTQWSRELDNNKVKILDDQVLRKEDFFDISQVTAFKPVEANSPMMFIVDDKLNCPKTNDNTQNKSSLPLNTSYDNDNLVKNNAAFFKELSKVQLDTEQTHISTKVANEACWFDEHLNSICESQPQQYPAGYVQNQNESLRFNDIDAMERFLTAVEHKFHYASDELHDIVELTEPEKSQIVDAPTELKEVSAHNLEIQVETVQNQIQVESVVQNDSLEEEPESEDMLSDREHLHSKQRYYSQLTMEKFRYLLHKQRRLMKTVSQGIVGYIENSNINGAQMLKYDEKVSSPVENREVSFTDFDEVQEFKNTPKSLLYVDGANDTSDEEVEEDKKAVKNSRKKIEGKVWTSGANYKSLPVVRKSLAPETLVNETSDHGSSLHHSNAIMIKKHPKPIVSNISMSDTQRKSTTTTIKTVKRNQTNINNCDKPVPFRVKRKLTFKDIDSSVLNTTTIEEDAIICKYISSKTKVTKPKETICDIEDVPLDSTINKNTCNEQIIHEVVETDSNNESLYFKLPQKEEKKISLDDFSSTINSTAMADDSALSDDLFSDEEDSLNKTVIETCKTKSELYDSEKKFVPRAGTSVLNKSSALIETRYPNKSTCQNSSELDTTLVDVSSTTDIITNLNLTLTPTNDETTKQNIVISPTECFVPYVVDSDNDDLDQTKAFPCYTQSSTNTEENTPKESTEELCLLVPKYKPPSRTYIVSTMDEFQLPLVYNQEPFYSDSNDVTGSVEIGMNVLNIPGRTVKFLKNFHEGEDVLAKSVSDYCKALDPTRKFTAKEIIDLKLSFIKCRETVVETVRKPPSRKEVEQWLKENCKESEEITPKSLEISEQLNESSLETIETSSSNKSTDKVILTSPVIQKSKDVQKKLVLRKLKRNKNVTNTSSGSMDNSCQITGATLNNTHGFRMSLENLQVRSVHEYQHITVLVMELHIETRGDLKPNPDLDQICAIFYSIFNDVPESPENIRDTSGVFAINRTSPSKTKFGKHLDGTGITCDVNYFETEETLIRGFVAFVHEWDPDILVGYEIEMLSWGYLIERSYKLGINLLPELSRIIDGPQHIKNKPINPDDHHNNELKVTGRIVLDLWRLLKHEIALQSYTFENMVYHVLHQRVALFSQRELSAWWNHRSDSYKHRTVNFYLFRVRTILKLMDQLDLIGRTSELARLFGILFFEVLSRGTQFRVESIMLRLAKPLKYIPVSPDVQQRARMRAPEFIPLILEPESKLYTDPVIVLDFQSLYPSIIIAYNYCFSTCVGRVEHLGEDHPFEFGATQLKVSRKRIQKLVRADRLNYSPCGVAFVKAHVRHGIMPRMLQEILDTRLMVKKSMKLYKDNGTLQRVLHSRQLGLKLIANVTYGYTAANFSGRMPAVEVGDSVVSKGRETLRRAIEMVTNNPKWPGCKVVYGDTDSLFVRVIGRDRTEAFRIGAEIAESVTADNPSPIKLKLEKVYQPCILQTKKRYVGYMYESADQLEPIYEAKGIETVRRDGCPAVAKMLEKCIHMLFESRDITQIKKYVLRQFSKILTSRVSIQDLTFAKEYRGSSGYRPGACVPAMELTKKWTSSDKRNEPRSGERVPYIIVKGPPGVPLIRLVRSPRELLADHSLKPNAIYYITRVIIPPLNRCFSLIGADFHQWFNEMPRKQHQYLPSSSPNKGKKTTISQYFFTTTCITCDQQTAEGVCETCLKNPQSTGYALYEKVRIWEQSYQNTQSICQSCTCQQMDIKCISLDCPVLYRHTQNHRDLQQANFIREIIPKLPTLRF